MKNTRNIMRLLLRRLLGTTNSGTKTRPPAPKHVAKRKRGEVEAGLACARVREVVEMERLTELVLATPGVMDEGLKLQDVPVGKPVHVKPVIAVV